MILGFNPWSWWGVRRLIQRRSELFPWCGRYRSMVRIKDWLTLLGFDVIGTSCYFYRPLLQRIPLMDRLRFMEPMGRRYWPALAGAYLIVAKKRQTTLTPIKPSWRAVRPRLLGAGLAKGCRRN